MPAGQPARHAVRPRAALRRRETAPSRRAPDPGGYSTIHSSPILRTAVQRGARRATCIIHCHRHIRAPPASWDRKISHQRHSSTARLPPFQGPAGRAAYCPQQQRRLLFSRASHHVSSHHSAALNCAPSSSPRPRPILRSRYAAQGRIVLEVLPCPLPSHRLAKRNACGTKRYGVVACQPVPTACRSSNAWPSFTLAHRRSPGQPWDSPGTAGQGG